jgi:hypothetical protein
MEPNVEVRRSYRLAAQGKNKHDAMCGQPVDVASTDGLCAAPTDGARCGCRLRREQLRSPWTGHGGRQRLTTTNLSMHRGSATAAARRFGCPIVAAELGAKHGAATKHDNDGELLIQQVNPGEKRDDALQQQR